jgi:hypothetical protein
MMPTNINHFTHKIMNDTPIPRTDEWETYCDECYYHLWRVRRKNERGFNDGYHVHNGKEAKALVDLLNKQDSELNTVTEQRDRLAEALERIGEEDGSPMSMRVCSTKSLVKQALQSLNPDHTVDSNDMIPAVKG